jgi:hypothetical protein
MNPHSASVTINNGVVRVLLNTELDHETERWFAEYLYKKSTAVIVDQKTMRLRGYEVPEREWEQFRFWLGVSLSSDPDEEA